MYGWSLRAPDQNNEDHLGRPRGDHPYMSASVELASRLPVYAERAIFELPIIYINGAKQGFLISIAPGELREPLTIREVEIAMA